MAFQIFRRASGDETVLKAKRTAELAAEQVAKEPTLLTPNAKDTGIDVAEEQNSLSGALQTAALLFANKQTKEARAALADAIEREDARAVGSWLAYLDLLRREPNRPRYEEVALKFVVQFERSAPSWDEISTEEPAKPAAIAAQAAFLTLPNSLTGEKPAAVTALIAQSKRPKTPDARLNLDCRELQEIDAQAAVALTKALTSIRRQKWPVEWSGLKEACDRMWKPLRAGEPRLRERWLVALELLVWMGREQDFENRAVDYAVTFEQSPPSWEAPTPEQLKWSMGAEKAVRADEMSLTPVDSATEVGSSVQKIEWKGDMTGPNDAQLKRFLAPTQETQRAEITMNYVRHVDFVCAGAISNGIVRVMASGRDVHIFGASPILRALLQITGVPENNFIIKRKT